MDGGAGKGQEQDALRGLRGGLAAEDAHLEHLDRRIREQTPAASAVLAAFVLVPATIGGLAFGRRGALVAGLVGAAWDAGFVQGYDRGWPDGARSARESDARRAEWRR
jgi:hypothetical protein